MQVYSEKLCCVTFSNLQYWLYHFCELNLWPLNTVGSQIAERFWEASLVQVVFKNATAVAFHSVEKTNIY